MPYARCSGAPAELRVTRVCAQDDFSEFSLLDFLYGPSPSKVHSDRAKDGRKTVGAALCRTGEQHCSHTRTVAFLEALRCTLWTSRT